MSKRRSAEHLRIRTLGYFVEMCDDATTSRDQCLVALLYLSGRRIGEIMHLQKQDLIWQDGICSFETFNEKVYRSQKMGNFVIFRNEKWYERIIVEFSYESESGKALVPYIQFHLTKLQDEDYLFHPLRPYDPSRHIGTNMAYKIITSINPDVWPHWFRHQRFSHYAAVYVDDPMSMQQVTHHKNIASTLKYIHRTEYLKKLKEV